MDLTVKLETVFGKFDRAEDQKELNHGKECDMTTEKKKPKTLDEISICLPD